MPVYSHMASIWPSRWACRADALPGMLVRSTTVAPSAFSRISAILPSRMFSEKFFEPIEIVAPSSGFTSASGPASVPPGT